MIEIKKRKRLNDLYIIVLFLLLVLIVTFFIMYKYHVEGEKNLPFDITKLIIVSSAETEDIEVNNKLYQANVLQKNDIYIAIQKNEKYKKNDAIKKITFNNFKVLSQGEQGNIKMYRASQGIKNFEYTKEYEIEEGMEFIGGQETNLNIDNMTISNQGGLLQFSIIIDDLGKITYSENEDILSDGTLLKRLNLSKEDINAEISFDMTMELESGNIFKTTITLELPTGNVIEEGVSTTENKDLSHLVFKRI